MSDNEDEKLFSCDFSGVRYMTGSATSPINHKKLQRAG